MQFNLTITFSKIMALIIFVGAFILDFSNDKSGTVFMFALPFVVALITGKQIIDGKKQKQ